MADAMRLKALCFLFFCPIAFSQTRDLSGIESKLDEIIEGQRRNQIETAKAEEYRQINAEVSRLEAKVARGEGLTNAEVYWIKGIFDYCQAAMQSQNIRQIEIKIEKYKPFLSRLTNLYKGERSRRGY